ARCCPSRARASSSRRRARSCRTTSAARSRTSATATWMRSCRVASCDHSSPGCFGSSAMPRDAELRLRERIARLKRIRLLGARVDGDIQRMEQQLEFLRAEPRSDDEVWQRVELARHKDRPYTLDYVERLLDDWVELHGDRARADDPAIVSGLGRFDGRTVCVIGHQKARD